MASRTRRHAAILQILQDQTVRSQHQLGELLEHHGFHVGQGTLSRDLRELGIVKRPGPDGDAAYHVPSDVADPVPALQRLAPALFLAADGVDHFLVVRTLTGGAQPLAVALDREAWDEILGTIAGDDTILVLLRSPDALDTVRTRLEKIAGV